MGITGLQTTIDENRRLTTENAALKARVAELEGIVRYQDAALKVLEKDGDDSLDWALRLESDRNAALEAETSRLANAKKKNHDLSNRANRAEAQVKRLEEQVAKLCDTIREIEGRPIRERPEDEAAQQILDVILKAEAAGDGSLLRFHVTAHAHLLITLALERLADSPWSLASARKWARLNRRAQRAEAKNARLEAENERLRADAEVGRILRLFIDEGHGYLEIDGGEYVDVHTWNNDGCVNANGPTLLDAFRNLAKDPGCPGPIEYAFRAGSRAALKAAQGGEVPRG